MTDASCKPAVEQIRAENRAAYTAARASTDGGCSEFRVGDALLDTAISVAATRLAKATDPTDKREAWRELQSLHQQRSADHVRRLEIERGLR